MLFSLFSVACLLAFGFVGAPKPRFQGISSAHPNVFLHGRWDKNVGSWWAGTGFKVNVVNLRHLEVNLGEHTTQPFAAAAVSIDGGPPVTTNLSAGFNTVALSDDVLKKTGKATTLVEINLEGWQNNRIQFKGLRVNFDAAFLPYNPKKRVIQFVGDSLSAGQFLPLGVNQAWPFLVAKSLKAESKINAQPGATFIDMESYGNAHGVSFQFWKTEDTGYFWTQDHNFTTVWDVRKETLKTTDLVIHIGANDASHSVPAEQFIETYLAFLEQFRKGSPALQNIYILTPFGWPHEGGTIDYYYDGVYAKVVEAWKTRRTSLGAKTHLVNCTGWIAFDDVFPDNVHPNVEGHQKIADKFVKTWVN